MGGRKQKRRKRAAPAVPPKRDEPVELTGAQGLKSEKINGVYKPTGEAYNDRPLYRKDSDSDVWLVFDKDGQWLVCDTDSKDANNGEGYAFCLEQGLKSPAGATKWMVLLGTTWEQQDSMAARRVRQQPSPDSGDSPEPEASPAPESSQESPTAKFFHTPNSRRRSQFISAQQQQIQERLATLRARQTTSDPVAEIDRPNTSETDGSSRASVTSMPTTVATSMASEGSVAPELEPTAWAHHDPKSRRQSQFISEQ